MRGGALPPALLCAALGLALSFAPPKARWAGLVVLLGVAVAASLPTSAEHWREAIFLGCWASVILAAAAVHLPGGLGPRAALILAANGGLWTGLVIGAAGQPQDLAKALPAALLCLPGAWLAQGRRQVVLKVLSSWLIAVAILAASLPLVPTPGYQADHMD